MKLQGKPSLACLGVLLALAAHSRSQGLVPIPVPQLMLGYVYQRPMTYAAYPIVAPYPQKQFELPSTPPRLAKQPEPQAEILPSPFGPLLPPRTAICVLQTGSGTTGEISGGVFLTQEMEGGPVVLSGTIQGLTPGRHGFHLHRDASKGADCGAAGPHFNPFNNTHGGPNDVNRHAGDFGNIEANELGVAFVSITVPGDMLSVEGGGKLGVLGRSIVIHEKEDDLGRGKAVDSLKTGAAGGRAACCVLTDLPPQQP